VICISRTNIFYSGKVLTKNDRVASDLLQISSYTDMYASDLNSQGISEQIKSSSFE